MRKLTQVFVATMLLIGKAYAQQPYVGCWFPEAIKNWSPETDKDSKFNRSKIPLATRHYESPLMRANENQHYEGQITNASILFPSASLSPSQGANNFVGYQPTYWQYMDKVVYWAGSSAEGVICPPPGDATDAAHQSGVKMLGILNFQPVNYGGNSEWFTELFKYENGTFPYAKKLYEMAKYLGFDGWFINYEVTSYAENNVADFIKAFNALADADNNHHMEIQWYKGHDGWPNERILKSHKNTSQFLEYHNEGDYRYMADKLGVTTAETFSKIYAGVECVHSGYLGYGQYLSRAFPAEGHVGSLALFCPEENTWKDMVRNYLNTPNAQGDLAHSAMARVFERENRTWTNEHGDPSNTEVRLDWAGISGHVLERSAITSMPFVSDMCVGIGKYRFVKGKQQGEQDWWHRGVQSVMPTWRYWVENRGESFQVEIDWDNAYNYGNSIHFSGSLPVGDHLTRLYKTKIPVTDGGILRVVYQIDGTVTMQPKLSTDGTVNANVTLPEPTTREENGWTIADYDLSSIKGSTVNMIAINFNAPEDYDYCDFYLGQIAMLPANYAPQAVAVSNYKVESNLGEEKGDIRLSWDYEYSKDFDRFDIYTVDLKGERVLRGQTRGEGFYIHTFNRNELDASVTVELVPVMKDGKEGAKMTSVLKYPELSAPEVTIVPAKSYLQVGEETFLTARGTGRPTTWAWTLPEGLQLVSGNLNEEQIKVRATAAGQQNVKVVVGNSAGETEKSIVAIDVVAAGAANVVQNVIKNKQVLDYSSSANSEETPLKIVDGRTGTWVSISDKWCVTKPVAWATFDLGGNYRVYGFKIHDCKSGPENNENFADYKIYLSEDGLNWNVAVDETGRMNDDIKEDYIIPTTARFVKLVPIVNNVLRIWEFEVFGQEDNNMVITAEKQTTMNVSDIYTLKVQYDLKGDARLPQFTCNAVSGNERMLKIGSIIENIEENCFNVTLQSKEDVGPVDVVVRINNGTSYKETTVKVIIDNPNAVNVLAGLKADVRKYENDYEYNVAYDGEETDQLTDGDRKQSGIISWFDASIYKQDVWAVFTAPGDTEWNLSKVKVYFENDNIGLPDDGDEGPAVKKIEAWTSDDMQNWKKVSIAEDFGSVASVEHMFATPVKAKYLAIVSTQNALFYSTISEVEAYESKVSTGINLNANITGVKLIGIYNLNGIKLDAPVKGVNVFKFSDGTIRKVFVR